MKVAYISKKFSASSMEVIDHANSIIEEYRRAGFSLTLRQLFYQFVRRLLLENSQAAYSRLGRIISDGRMAGLVDWDAIEDRTRDYRTWKSSDDMPSYVRSMQYGFSLDPWEGAPAVPEVWVEKQALESIVQDACWDTRTGFFACRGYVSATEMRQAAQRILSRKRNHFSKTVIIHLGDHDPSGLDMTRDITDRLGLFMGERRDDLLVSRIALNMDQVIEYRLPPNPAKESDSRWDDYQRTYGDKSWELDALEPQVIVRMIRAAISATMGTHRGRHQKIMDEAKEGQELLGTLARKWSDVSKLLK